jgi:hypothetical protein
VQRFGQLSALIQFLVGATLGFGMDFWSAFWALTLGSVILEIVAIAIGVIGMREGLSTTLRQRRPRDGAVSTPDPAVTALARSVDRATRSVEKVETALVEQRETVAGLAEQATADHDRLMEVASTVAEMAPAVAEQTRVIEQILPVVASLSQKVAAIKPQREPAAKPFSWMLATEPGPAQEALNDLVKWHEGVYLAYPGVSLPACWGFHPDVVEELLALRRAHCDAYQGEKASGVAALDWHSKHRPGVVQRISAAHGTCTLTQHEPGGKAAKPAPTVPLAGHTDVIAGNWAVEHETPQPNQQQLDEAKQVQETRLQGSRR